MQENRQNNLKGDFQDNFNTYLVDLGFPVTHSARGPVLNPPTSDLGATSDPKMIDRYQLTGNILKCQTHNLSLFSQFPPARNEVVTSVTIGEIDQ